MSTTEERAGFLPVPAVSELPPPSWIEPLVKRYVRALVTYHEEVVAGGHTDVFVMQTLERLLRIQKGVR